MKIAKIHKISGKLWRSFPPPNSKSTNQRWSAKQDAIYTSSFQNQKL